MRRLLLVMVILAPGCGDNPLGSGIGLPPIDPNEAARPERLPLVLTEAVLTPAGPADRFVEILNDGSGDIDLSGLSLCAADCIDLTGTVTAGGRHVAQDLTGLSLHAGAGEVAVVDGAGVAHAYLAWGANSTSALAAAAIASGAAQPGEHVPLPFPLTHAVWASGGAALAVAHEGVVFGCAPPSPGAVASFDPSLCALDPTAWGLDPVDCTNDPAMCAAAMVGVRVTELLPAPALGGDSWVELINPSQRPVALGGVRLCQMPSCVLFSVEHEIAAGDYIQVHLGSEAGADAREISFADAEPVRSAGELVVLAPGALAAETPGIYQSFVRYGATTGQLSAIAVAAGLWSAPLDAARQPRIENESLSLHPAGGNEAAAWNPTRTTTPLLPNRDIGETSSDPQAEVWGLWDSCSYPRSWDTPELSPLRVRRVVRGTPAPPETPEAPEVPATIEILNASNDDVQLESWLLEMRHGAVDVLLLADKAEPADSGQVASEAVARQPNGSDTDHSRRDFSLAAATIGSANPGAQGCEEGVVINEVVTSPAQDWSDGGFDATPGLGVPDDGDAWVELLNCGESAVDLTGWVLQLDDTSPTTFQLDAVDGGQTLVFSAGGSVTALGAGEYLVIGAPAGTAGSIDDEVVVLLIDASDALVDEVGIGSTSLSPGAVLTFELREKPPCTSGTVCWTGSAVANAAELGLTEAGVLRSFLQWGNVSTAALSIIAVADNLWPLVDCTLPALLEGETIELASDAEGRSPPDYQ